MEELEIDLEYMTKEQLLVMLQDMHRRDVTFNDYVTLALKDLIERDNDE